MDILGLSCYFHDAAACLYRDGSALAAAEEERFSRLKHDARFPTNAARYCLNEGEIGPRSLRAVVFHEKPLRKFDRIIRSSVDGSPASFGLFVGAMRSWISEKIWVPSTIRSQLGFRGPVLYVEHHASHAASAFYISPFDRAGTLTVDGVGEHATVTIGAGEGRRLTLIKEIRFPHSLGLLYSAITAFLGFEINEGEYKVMGLAGYGKPRHIDAMRKLLRLHADGSFSLDLRYFRYHHELAVWSRALEELLGRSRRPEDPIDERHADIAASLQAITEEAVVRLAEEVVRETGYRQLAMAGGVALNVVANREILRRGGIDQLFVPPAPGDSGAALGAAAYVAHTVYEVPRASTLRTAFLGPSFDAAAIAAFLSSQGIAHTYLGESLLQDTANRIANGQVIGWFQGRMEFGPRALGARSIIADPTRAGMKDLINVKIKHREPFRPFAPAVLRDAAARYFRDDIDSPFMLLVSDVLPERRDEIAAITHVDGTARVQTVRREDDPLFYGLIQRVGEQTGTPMVLNTSFNVRGEPIVCTPADAYRTFCATELDALVMGPFLVEARAKRATGPSQVGREQAVWLS